MNAAKIIQEANMDLDNNRITIKEYQDRIKPFTDVECVVRCKDCQYGEKSIVPYKDYWCSFYDRYTPPEWFCADGKKKIGSAQDERSNSRYYLRNQAE